MKDGSMLHFVEFLLFQFSITAFSGLYSRSSYSDIFQLVSVRNSTLNQNNGSMFLSFPHLLFQHYHGDV